MTNLVIPASSVALGLAMLLAAVALASVTASLVIGGSGLVTFGLTLAYFKGKES